MMAPPLPYALRAPIGGRARFGLIALQTDETIEAELGALLAGEEQALLTSRIPSGDAVTAETLAAMEADLPRAAGLLPKALEFDVIGYGCTSGATTIGPQTVAGIVRAAARARHVTDPLSAVIAACGALEVKRLAMVTPYVAEVSASMRAALEAAGITIAGFGSFDIEDDATVARVDEASMLAAARSVGAADCDGVFIACTNLRGIGMIPEAEAALGRPVFTSNLALGWHMRRLAGLAPLADARARLMRI